MWIVYSIDRANMSSSESSAPPMPDEDVASPSKTEASPSKTEASPTKTEASPTKTEASPSQPKRTPEIGPNTLIESARIVAAHYNGSITNVMYELEPVVRDGSIVEFFLPGTRTRLAQGRIWVAATPIFDKDHNAFLPIAVRDINYQPATQTIRFSDK